MWCLLLSIQVILTDYTIFKNLFKKQYLWMIELQSLWGDPDLTLLFTLQNEESNVIEIPVKCLCAPAHRWSLFLLFFLLH